MTGAFILERAGDESSDTLIASAAGGSPFCTPEYARAMQHLGHEVWVVGVGGEQGPPDLALACIRRGRLESTLEFPSLPAAAGLGEFWSGVDRFCGRSGITSLVASTFGSPEFELPALQGEVSRHERTEFVLSLPSADLNALLSSNHKRNVKKARNAGVSVRRSRSDIEWLAAHFTLMGDSMQRRASRGEAVSVEVADATPRAFMLRGAAELFQATLEGEVLSSLLVLRSQRCVYYHSAGTSPRGMSLGASHFLVHSAALSAQTEGLGEFNLGGAPQGSPLARFKSGFGGSVRRLEAASCARGPAWKKKLRTFVRMLRDDRAGLVRALTGSSSRMLVFGFDTGRGVPPSVLPGARLEPLTAQQIDELRPAADDREFRARQMDRLRRFNASYAYAVYLNDEIAHVSWLLPPVAVVSDPPPQLRLGDDEAEITACETLPAFRRKGIYRFAIQQLLAVARDRGIRRVYMKTAEDNTASQSGIRQAGFQPIGSINTIHPPLQPSRTIVRHVISWT